MDISKFLEEFSVLERLLREATKTDSNESFYGLANKAKEKKLIDDSIFESLQEMIQYRNKIQSGQLNDSDLPDDMQATLLEVVGRLQKIS